MEARRRRRQVNIWDFLAHRKEEGGSNSINMLHVMRQWIELGSEAQCNWNTPQGVWIFHFESELSRMAAELDEDDNEWSRAVY